MTAEVFNHLWQSTLFALAACGLIVLFRRGSSWSRHFIAWVGLAKFLVPFSVLGWFIPLGKDSGSLHNLTFLGRVPEWAEPSVPATMDLIAVAAPMEAASPDIPWSVFLLTIWLGGFVILFGRRWIQFLRCKRSIATACAPADATWQNLALTQMRGDRRAPPRIVIHGEGDLTAGVFGLRDATIVIPEKMDRAFDARDREVFLRHELQHVLKKDNLWLFIQKCIRDLAWFHPLVYWLDRQISNEREIMRDEEVLQKTNNKQSYINCLMKASIIDLPNSYANSVGIKGSPFARRLRAIASHKSNAMHKLISACASIMMITALTSTFLVSTVALQAQTEDTTNDNASIKELLVKNQALEERLEQEANSLEQAKKEHRQVIHQLRQALMRDNRDEDLTDEELKAAHRLLARWESEKRMSEDRFSDDDRRSNQPEKVARFRELRNQLRELDSAIETGAIARSSETDAKMRKLADEAERLAKELEYRDDDDSDSDD